MTISLYDFMQSELIKRGLDEFEDEEGNLLYFKEESQFLSKILAYDDDVKDIINHLFNGVSLTKREHDEHFKKTFLYRFINRRFNRQTVESFKLELMMTFLTQETFLNQLYENMEKYIHQSQINTQTNQQLTEQLADGVTTTDNRQAYADLPQNDVQIDVDSTIMNSASDNTISRNKQQNQQQTEGLSTGTVESENKQFQFDTLFQSSSVMNRVLNLFDEHCFMQTW